MDSTNDFIINSRLPEKNNLSFNSICQFSELQIYIYKYKTLNTDSVDTFLYTQNLVLTYFTSFVWKNSNYLYAELPQNFILNSRRINC
jgi:hypothetical protein